MTALIKKYGVLALGYAAFFAFIFVAAFYFTFDADVLVSMVRAQAAGNNIQIEVKKASLRRVIGLDLRGVRIVFPKTVPDQPSPILIIDRLVISPSLSSLFSVMSAAREGKPPAVAASFHAWLGEGSIQGEVEQKPPSITVSKLEVKKLPLNRIPVYVENVPDFSINGEMTARIKQLSLGDVNRPNTWNGDLQIDLEKPTIEEFTFAEMKVAPIVMDKGTIKATMENGQVNIETVRIQGEDLPVNVQGTVSLRAPLGKSTIKLSGSVKVGESYKEKMPIVSSILPNLENYEFTGTLDSLFTGF